MLVMLSHCHGNNEECASYKVDGIMRSVHILNSSKFLLIVSQFHGNDEECAS